MTPHTQTIFVNDPRGIPGDCMRTAVASLLDLPTQAVPHFVLFEDWFGAFNLWLNGRGLRIHPLPASNVDRECLALGMSPRDVEHVVVWGAEGLVHDPHPSRAGIEARQFWALVPIAPADCDWDRVHNRPADIYTPPEDRVVRPEKNDV